MFKLAIKKALNFFNEYSLKKTLNLEFTFLVFKINEKWLRDNI